MRYYNDDDRAHRADNSTKIFNNRTKGIVFLITLMIGALTIWDKCSSLARSSATDSVKTRPVDSPGSQQGTAHQGTAPAIKHHRPKTEPKPADEIGQTSAGAASTDERPATPHVTQPAVRALTPLQVTNVEDIEFKLLSAEGNSRAQTIRMTVILTNHAANRFVWSAVESISDADGNEYVLKSFTNGASSYDMHIPLDTEVPRKCTYTFGGVLPSVKMIRLFKFRYRHKSLDDPNFVDFRDIPIDWR